MGPLFALVLSLLAIFLILLVLVQRGRGGGLAGALGGMGGSSAFGAKAGDVFTRITIITASIWIAICLFALLWAKHKGDAFGVKAIVNPAPASTDPGTMPPFNAPADPTGSAADTKSAATGETAPPAATPPTETPAAPPAAATTPPPAAPGTETPAAPATEATNNEAPPGK